MLDKNESRAILRLIRSERKTSRQSLQLASLYTAQALLSSSLLIAGYSLAHAHALTWAIISALLVIQPGVEQSLAASAVRIAANLIGGLIGLAIGELLGLGYPQLLLALILTVFLSELLRLDLGLRTACVATVIVMTAIDGHVTTSAAERLSAVLIGCCIAVAVQLLAEQLRRIAGWTDPFFSATTPKSGPSEPNQE